MDDNGRIMLFDSDDVCVDLVGHWIDILNKIYNLSKTVHDIKEWDIAKYIPELTRDQVFEVLFDNHFYDNLQPIKNSNKYINLLLREGYKIQIVTATDYRVLGIKIPRLLELFPMLTWEENFTVTHNKLLMHGDLLVDDNIDNLGGIYHKSALFTAPHNKLVDNKRLSVDRLDNWEKLYAYIKKKFPPK